MILPGYPIPNSVLTVGASRALYCLQRASVYIPRRCAPLDEYRGHEGAWKAEGRCASGEFLAIKGLQICHYLHFSHKTVLTQTVTIYVTLRDEMT